MQDCTGPVGDNKDHEAHLGAYNTSTCATISTQFQYLITYLLCFASYTNYEKLVEKNERGLIVENALCSF